MAWFDTLFAQYQGVSAPLIVLELVAVIFGMVSVVLVGKGRLASFPVGIVSTAGFVWLLWVYSLYGDMLINAYYTVLSIYGWTQWSQQQAQRTVFAVSPFTRKDAKICAGLSLFSLLFVGAVYWFKPYLQNGFSFTGVELGWAQFVWTDYTDIFTTALFLVAMWLMAERKIEHWLVWIVADAVSVPLYYHKGLLFSALQYFFFTLIALRGYSQWKTYLHNQAATPSASP
ncbi:nicotinamide riboside transporter PnuC [Neisseria yangbaofengii]|uniref:nicotinamide riboside transporter PnuC n=1 Tax=Neisseria yangbaofengii TaxID=2709396 RepID=UPI00197F783F|nr:nicotinamide riboside transporter PnuC [Neisseria yangbaofengii]